MKIKTAELEGAALDYCVAKANKDQRLQIDALGKPIMLRDHVFHDCRFSTDWAQGGPIIDHLRISITTDAVGVDWTAYARLGMDGVVSQGGPTALVASMRTAVAVTLGDSVDVPEELV